VKTRRIGSLEVSVVGLGTNNFGFRMDEPEVPPVVDAALEAGINFFDTADSYGLSEQRLARALGSRRDEVVIGTKFATKIEDGPGGAAPDYVRHAVERSLRELGTDRIDLYQIHRPDPDTPIADTMAVLDELVRAGKVREIGCSNFSAAQLREAEAAAAAADGARFVSVQNHFNLLHQDGEEAVLDECAKEDVAYLPFFPLASGLLTGKYQRGQAAPEGTRLAAWGSRATSLLSDESFDVVDRLAQWAEARGHSLLELAFAWLLAHEPVASVIAGATKVDQVHANVAAGEWELTAAERDEVTKLAGS
jgi:aryl-alcohol dehydrogenase-like predicted oxidoreductase